MVSLGRLRENPTITGFRVTPVVGHVAADADLVANPAEVATVFTVPLAWLLDPGNRRSETREINGRALLMHYFEYEQHLI